MKLLVQAKKINNCDTGIVMRKAKSYSSHEAGPKKRTSIGNSIRSRPKHKHKRRMKKSYRGQGRRCN